MHIKLKRQRIPRASRQKPRLWAATYDVDKSCEVSGPCEVQETDLRSRPDKHSNVTCSDPEQVNVLSFLYLKSQ